MKVFRVSGYGYTTNVQASDRQHARTKFLNSLRNVNTSGTLLTEGSTSILSESEVNQSYLNFNP